MAELVQHDSRTSASAHPKKEKSGRIVRLKNYAFRPGQTENRRTATLRSFLRIVFITYHEFFEIGISLRASALTYSLILSLIPMLAMSTAVLKGLGGSNQLKTVAYRFINQLDPGELHKKGQHLLPDSAEGPAAEKPFSPAASNSGALAELQKSQETAYIGQSLASHLRRAADLIFAYVDQTNFAALGAFGIVGLLLAVILVMNTIEEAMNAIWHSEQSRPLSRKIMNYLALLVILPISINVAIAGEAILESPDLLARIHTVIPSTWAIKMLLNVLPFFFIIFSLMAMYMFFANVWVKSSAAFTGAFFAGICWFAVQKLYILLQLGVAKYNAIYGTFATVPLFLIWIHLGWTFILLGALLSYAIQNRNQYNLPGTVLSPQRSLQLAFDILTVIYGFFAEKKSASFDDLSEAIPAEQLTDIRLITDTLIGGGYLHQIHKIPPAYVPAAPADKLEARDVVRLIFGHEEISTIGGRYSEQVLQAAESAISGKAFPLSAAEDEQLSQEE